MVYRRGCDIVSTGRQLPTFRRIVMSSLGSSVRNPRTAAPSSQPTDRPGSRNLWRRLAKPKSTFPGPFTHSCLRNLLLGLRKTGVQFIGKETWGPHRLLYNGYRVFSAGLKRSGRGVDHPPPSSARD